MNFDNKTLQAIEQTTDEMSAFHAQKREGILAAIAEQLKELQTSHNEEILRVGSESKRIINGLNKSHKANVNQLPVSHIDEITRMHSEIKEWVRRGVQLSSGELYNKSHQKDQRIESQD